MSALPITPDEAAARKAAALPDYVIEVFNDLIAAAWDGHRAVVKQDDAAELIFTRGMGDLITCQEMYDRHFLDIEPIYQAAGWDIVYEKPGFNETGTACFTFTRSAAS